MSLSSHVEELKRKHQTLSDRVDDALKSPSATDAEIAELKKQKLQLKDEIERLSANA